MKTGDRVKIAEGIYAGHSGRIASESANNTMYVVSFDDGSEGIYYGDELTVVAQVPDYGMTSAQLAEYTAEFITAATSRVIGVGDAQYSQGSSQKFEDMPLPELFDWMDEELQDVAVYAAMLSIRLRRLRDAATRVDRAVTHYPNAN